MVQFFRLTPPSIHGMVVPLEQLGLVTRHMGAGGGRSARVVVPEENMPDLIQQPPRQH
jgi:hypothetical protein